MTILVFTDGGCIGNGKKNAKASFAVYMNNTIYRGHVKPYEYIMQNNKLIVNTEKSILPSNNRGELLSIIYAFLEIIKSNNTQKYMLFSDSMICVKTINIWYENRLRKGTTNQFKNPDLINIMMTLYNQVKDFVSVIHTRGHQKITKSTTESEKIIINGNNIVDQCAASLLLIKDFIEYEVIHVQ